MLAAGSNLACRYAVVERIKMKSKLIIVGFCVMLLSGGYAFAEDQKSNDKGSMGSMMQNNATGETSKAVEVGNKICPVSGNKIGEMGEPIKYEYKGKIYNLCCPMCVKDFKKDPEKYSKIADESKEKESK